MADYEALKGRLREYRRKKRRDDGLALQEAGQRLFPTPRIGISARGGKCRLRHVRVLRDVYYTTPPLSKLGGGPMHDYARGLRLHHTMPGWGVTERPIELAKPDDRDLHEFFVLGDNSPQSLDGRSWTAAAPTLRLYDDRKHRLYKLGTVPRYNLIGKALFVYWPSGFRLPGLPSLPVVPNVGGMRLIR